jgi:hypothetical protein
MNRHVGQTIVFRGLPKPLKLAIASGLCTAAAFAQTCAPSRAADAGPAVRAAYLKTWAAPVAGAYTAALLLCTFLGLRQQRRQLPR